MKPIIPQHGYKKSDVTDSADFALGDLSGGIPAGAVRVLMRIEGGDGRWRSDGGSCASSNGVPILQTDSPLAYDGPLDEFRIRSDSGTITLHAAFFGSRSLEVP